MTTRHGDFGFRHAERFGDQCFEGAVGFVVLGRGADAGFEVGAGVVFGAAIDAIGAAGGSEADAEFAQAQNPRSPSSIPSSQ